MSKAWKINSEGGALIEEFRKGRVAIGWYELGDLRAYQNQDALKRKLAEVFPQQHKSTLANWAAMLEKVVRGMAVGDAVVVYDRNAREYWLGRIGSDYRFAPSELAEWPNLRTVEWYAQIPRASLSVNARNSLGALLAICAVRDDVWLELEALSKGEPKAAEVLEPESETEAIQNARQDLEEQAKQLIADRIDKLDDRQLEQLVAGILRAMGFKTRVSPTGPDRGVDVLASPDGLGLQEPRIKAEVKHRKGQSGSQMLRSLIATLRPGDKGLFVSTGGFSKDARYEADRASQPVALVDMDDLVELITSHYESFDMDSKALVPLTRLYWPAE